VFEGFTILTKLVRTPPACKIASCRSRTRGSQLAERCDYVYNVLDTKLAETWTGAVWYIMGDVHIDISLSTAQTQVSLAVNHCHLSKHLAAALCHARTAPSSCASDACSPMTPRPPGLYSGSSVHSPSPTLHRPAAAPRHAVDGTQCMLSSIGAEARPIHLAQRVIDPMIYGG
jgi:hypothetical protein